MTQESLTFIYFSEVLGLPVRSASGNGRLGRVVDMAAATGQVYPTITGLLVKKGGWRSHDPVYIPWSSVRWPHVGADMIVEEGKGNGQIKASEHEILLKKSFLDRQLISTSGYKVVRVNDLQLLVESAAKENPNLWLVHIDIGVKGLLRRLGVGRPVNAIVRWLLDRDMKDKFVSWKHVQPTTTTNVYGSLRLTTDSSKLSEIHPADLADILEDLGADERNTMVESLDPATAAVTLQEMPLSLRVRVAESIDTDKLGLIVRAMQMDNLVDLLEDLSPEKRTAIMATLPPDTVAEIKDLSHLSPSSVGSIMNTSFLVARPATTVRDALALVRNEAWKAELIYYLYIVEGEDRLRGVVTLRHMLMADGETPMFDLMRENPLTVTADTRIKKVARIFFKYNFEAVPVVDDEGRIQGIVTMRDTLESVFPEVREESKG